MGREARRVPLDFDWPAGKVWDGYLLPARLRETTCPTCGGRGDTADLRWLEKVAYVLVGLADDVDSQARGRQMHPWLIPLQEISYGGDAGQPTEAFARFVDDLAAQHGQDNRPSPFGRQHYTMLWALMSAAGLEEGWGQCQDCAGHGSTEAYPGQRAEAEAWEPTDPPTGDGWQMWETTSEGSPKTPVFATPAELAEYCAVNVSIFGSSMAPQEQWLSIITGDDFAHVQVAPGVIIL